MCRKALRAHDSVAVGLDADRDWYRRLVAVAVPRNNCASGSSDRGHRSDDGDQHNYYRTPLRPDCDSLIT